MEKIILLVLPFFAASCGLVKQQASAPEPVNVMSFNIRYDNPEDSLDNWRYRKDRVANAIHFYDVDILGTQEVLHNQLEDLKLRLPEYGVVGVGREDGKEKGEYSALWYKKDRFNVLDSGYFWLSETPEVAGSTAPVFMDANAKCRHQWLIEFAKMPDSIEKFAMILDATLKEVNSDYEAKRWKDIALQPLEVIVARKGLFHDWLAKKGKLGGQHKVPRLSNTRDYIEEMIALNER